MALGGGAYATVLWPMPAAARGNTQNATMVLEITYKSTDFLFEDGLAPRAKAWLDHISNGALAGAVAVSSTSPPLVSDGRSIRALK